MVVDYYSLHKMKFESVFHLCTGVLMWEVFTCAAVPYTGMKNPDVVHMVCQQKRHLSKPTSCPDTVFRIMTQCFRYVSASSYRQSKSFRTNSALLFSDQEIPIRDKRYHLEILSLELPLRGREACT